MSNGRPPPLDRLERDYMHRLTGTAAENRHAARRTLAEAKSFQSVAKIALDSDGLALPAVSNLHEAARLAITAIATGNGRRFSNTTGSHEAVVDYALAIGLVDERDHARLDTLRRLRHQVNYPADLVEPSARELTQVNELVDRVITSAGRRLGPRIPPPPTRGRRL